MSKMKNVFQKLSSVILGLIFLELFVLSMYIDILPFIYTCFICAFFLIVMHRTEGNFRDLFVFKKDVTSIIFTILLCFVLITIAILYSVLGIEKISLGIINLLNMSIYFRFLIYGFIIPVVNIFLMSWCYTGVSPFESISLDVVTILSMVNLFIGLFICMNWQGYLFVANMILNFF